MSNLPRVVYTAKAVVTGGREGHARTSDGRLDIDLDVPSEMGGSGGPAPIPNSSSRRATAPASNRRFCGSPPNESSTPPAGGSRRASASGR